MALVDVLASVLLLLVVSAVLVAYATYGMTRTMVRTPRIDQIGASPFLGFAPMEAAYFLLTPFGRWLVRLGVSANQITWTSLILGGLTGAALAFGHFGIAAVLSACSALGDALDGFVARESHTASRSGETLDAAVDRYVDFFFLGGLCIAYRFSAAALGLCLVAVLGCFMVSYATAKAEALAVDPQRGLMRRAERATYLTLGVGLAPIVGTVGHFFGIFWLSPDLPVIAAVSLVGVVANVSAVRRLVRTAELTRPPSPRVPQTIPGIGFPAPREPLLSLRLPFVRHQLSSIAATALDFALMVLLVERGHVDPALATLAGATLGGVTSFLLNKHFAFMTLDNGIRSEALRYAMTSAGSAALNGVGVRVFASWVGLPYFAVRVSVAALVSIFWNFPMHRMFVFRERARSA